MAQLGSFGIAHPIYNSRFNIAKRITTTFTSTTAGPPPTITVVVPTGVPSDLDHFFGYADSVHKQDAGRWNKIIVGPSTDSANTGAMEVFDVINASMGVITVEQTPVYAYVLGDPVTLIGTGMPDGWVGRLNKFAAGRICDAGGYSDNYSFYIADLTGWAADTNYATLEIGSLLANNYYKLEVQYKTASNFTVAGAPRVSVYENQGGSQVAITASNIPFVLNTSWTIASAMFKTSDDQGGSSKLLLTCSTATGYWLRVGSISLTHVLFGSDLEYNTDGSIRLSEWPVLGSVSIKRFFENSKLIRNLDGSRKVMSVLHSQIMPITKYVISYKFDHISSASITYLRKLIDWQQRGYLINHFPGLLGIPHCLTGRIRLRTQRAKLDNLSLRDISLSFEEVV